MEYNIHDSKAIDTNILNKEENELWSLYMEVLTGAGLGDVSEWMKLDLSMPQMKILMLLNNKGRLKVSEIATSMGASMSNMTGLLDRLEKEGFVKRVHSQEDRRTVYVELGEKTLTIFRGLYKKGHVKIKNALELMSEDEKLKVKEGLTILASTLNKPDQGRGNDEEGTD
ncbi:MarR family transcriptional regulator [Virgibacillus necropolis]|uniref:MarR family transcriptional regulator n=1 Tax=Virgibacillus necropolis TaxID=163877 RepID=UPI003850CE8B